MPDIKLYFLQASRAIRTAWQLEELGLDYQVDFAPRVNKVAPADWKKKIGGLGKSPTLLIDDLSITESGAICDYLEEKHDPQRKLLPTDPAQRVEALKWVHASEGTFMLHALAITYTRWFGTETPEAAKTIEESMAVNVQRDFEHLERVLSRNGTGFLVGRDVSVADCMMLFSVTFILARGLGVRAGEYPAVERWVRRCEALESYKRAVERTGYDLSQSG